MSGFYSARFERERREKTTPERIVQIARSNGQFRASLRYRDSWLRERCARLKAEGLLVGGKRKDRALIYYPAALPTSTNSESKTDDRG